MTTVERRCPSGHAVSATATFCTTCGSTVDAAPAAGRVCPGGHPVADGAAFCPTCGRRVGTPGAPALSPTVGFAAPPPLTATSPPPDGPAGYPPASYPPGAYPPQGIAPWGSPYVYEPQAPISGLAVAAFLVSLVWLYGLTSVVAIVLGVTALRRAKERKERGRGLAIAAIVIGGAGVCIALGVLLVYA